jgi:hypothetical protein
MRIASVNVTTTRVFAAVGGAGAAGPEQPTASNSSSAETINFTDIKPPFLATVRELALITPCRLS